MKSYPVALVAALLLMISTASAQEKKMKGEQQRPPLMMMKSDGVDLSALGMIDRAGSDTLIVNLKEQIEEHNKMLVERFDTDKNGKLDEKETAVMDYVVSMRNRRPPMPPQEKRMPPERRFDEMPPPPPDEAMQEDMPEIPSNGESQTEPAGR